MPTPATVKGAKIGISLNNPPLKNTEPEALCSFLCNYDQYSSTVLALTRQLTTDTLTIEATKPVDFKFCVDIPFLESNIALGFISDAKTY